MSQLNTNEDLIQDLITYSPYGALSQTFVMYAVRHYAKMVIEAGPEACDSAFLSGEAWVGVATDIQTRCDAFYSRHDRQVVANETEPGEASDADS